MIEIAPLLPAGITLRRLADTPTDAEYKMIARILTACNPHQPVTASELSDRDVRRGTESFQVRFLAERDGEGVGTVSAGQSPWQNDPQHFMLNLSVVPDQRRQGIGSALYNAATQVISSYTPTKIGTSFREDWADSVRFAEHRGFVEGMREWESRLDVTAFAPQPFAARLAVPVQHGIEITTLKALQQTVPDWAMRLYELEKETFQDVPTTDPFTPPEFPVYERMILQSPSYLPEANAVAVDRATGEWVGSSGLWKQQSNNWLNTGLTGVKRSHRRQGIAFALKLKVIDYAKSVGCPVITTENATTNRGMLSINEALGFVKQPVWIVAAKRASTTQENER